MYYPETFSKGTRIVYEKSILLSKMYMTTKVSRNNVKYRQVTNDNPTITAASLYDVM